MANKVILSGGIAKRLLLRGHIIHKVKTKNENPLESCFIFFTDCFFKKDLDDIMNHKGNDVQSINSRLKSLNITEQEYRKGIFEEYIKTIQ